MSKPLVQIINLPPEDDVLPRNRAITAAYAQLYLDDHRRFKWAGMAAFASFHIGEKLKLWNWKKSGIKSFSETCQKKNRKLEDDFQIIRIINNRIFAEIGSLHVAFYSKDYETFRAEIIAAGRHDLIITAFDKLHQSTVDSNQLVQDRLIWEATADILYHEQQFVVQPMFDKLSTAFSGVMSLMASFDYRVTRQRTTWRLASRFIRFISLRGWRVLRTSGYFPDITHFDQRWFWITSDLMVKWRVADKDQYEMMNDVRYLSNM